MDFDVVIAGGGPSGLSAAQAAAAMGARVAVVEKSREIGYPIHTSGGSWIEDLKALDIPERFMSPVSEGLFLSANSRAEFRYDTPPSCILDIRGLYQYLAESASRVGAQIYVDTTVTGPLLKNGRMNGVRTRRFGKPSFLRASVVIDATGCAGLLARKMGLSRGFKRFGIGAEYDLLDPDWPKGRVAFLFGSNYAPSGYGWVFPHGDERVRVGVGVIRPDTQAEPREYLERIIADSGLFAPERISKIEYHTGQIPSEIYLPRTYSDGLLVVGDAGGLISTLLGEGIRFAIDIGRMAGEHAAEAAKRTCVGAAFLSGYERKWRRKYGRLFKMSAALNRRLGSYSDEQWDSRVEALSALPAHLIPSLLRGDFSLSKLTGLLCASPGLFGRILMSSLGKSAKFA